jgi:hypothetical protein
VLRRFRDYGEPRSSGEKQEKRLWRRLRLLSVRKLLPHEERRKISIEKDFSMKLAEKSFFPPFFACVLRISVL